MRVKDLIAICENLHDEAGVMVLDKGRVKYVHSGRVNGIPPLVLLREIDSFVVLPTYVKIMLK